jgi:hypothetical protein
VDAAPRAAIPTPIRPRSSRPRADLPRGRPQAEGEQQDAVNTLSKKLAGTDKPGAELKKTIERELREDDPDFSFAEDVDPWLGDRIALFATNITVSGREPDAQVAIVAPAKDADKARETLEAELGERDKGEPAPRVVERTHRDVKYKVETNEDSALAIVDDYVVFGNDQGVKAAIDAREGSSLANADPYKKAREKVAKDGLGIMYVSTQQLLSALGPQGAALRPALGQLGDSLAVALDADETRSGPRRPRSASRRRPQGRRREGARRDARHRVARRRDPDIGGQIEQSLRQFGQLGASAASTSSRCSARSRSRPASTCARTSCPGWATAASSCRATTSPRCRARSSCAPRTRTRRRRSSRSSGGRCAAWSPGVTVRKLSGVSASTRA